MNISDAVGRMSQEFEGWMKSYIPDLTEEESVEYHIQLSQQAELFLKMMVQRKAAQVLRDRRTAKNPKIVKTKHSAKTVGDAVERLIQFPYNQKLIYSCDDEGNRYQFSYYPPSQVYARSNPKSQYVEILDEEEINKIAKDGEVPVDVNVYAILN